MDNLYWLDQIQTQHHQQVGDQALHLSYLWKRGYAIVPSFVVSSALFREFLASIQWSDPLFFDLAQSSLHVNVEDALQLQAIARQIQRTIAATPLPADWVSYLESAVAQFWSSSPVTAVMLRPSLTLHGAKVNGFFPTLDPEVANLLDGQTCWTDGKSLEVALKKLWAQAFRARNLLYWQRSNLQLHQIQLAVIVQPVLNATASGYLQRQDNDWEVLATWGLGHAIAHGEVLPDFYQIRGEDGAMLSQKLGTKTIAYRVKNPPSVLSKTDLAPIEPYLLSEIQHKQFALNSSDLHQFGQLAQQLTADFRALLVVEWTRSDSTVHLTQVSTQMFGSSQAASLSAKSLEVIPKIQSSTLIVSGLAAAPGQAIAQATVISDWHSGFSAIPSGTILVISTILPDWLPLLGQSVGIIAEQGGMTSHGAILAREFGIPAVVGAAQATQRIQTGDWLLVDGDRGEVHSAQSKAHLPLLVTQNSDFERFQTRYSNAEMNTTSAEQDSPIATQLMVNLSQADRVEQAASLAVDGVGLLRSELMIVSILEGQHPRLWLQKGRQAELTDRLANQIRQFVEAFAPRPVFYRSLDLRSHEFRSLEGSETASETNPMLGVRGTFSYVLNPELFEVELAALRQIQQAGYSNLRLTLPFVRTVEEFVFCRQRVEQSNLTQQSQFQLWIMAEVPSVLFLLPEYVQAGVEGISIGTNDLTQLLLGVDRDQSLMASAFDEQHPAVLSAIDHLIKTTRHLKIPCSICGAASIS